MCILRAERGWSIMLNWIVSHSQIINSMINLAMLVVWVAYLQTFISSYHRQTRSKIMITRNGVYSLKSRCLVCNMSSETIYLLSLLIELDTPDGHKSYPITEIEGFDASQKPSDDDVRSRQGPLESGKVRDMGSFQEMIAHALGEGEGTISADEQHWPPIESLKVRAIASYGSEDLPVGACRSFKVRRKESGWEVHPHTSEARQIRSRRERKELKSLLDNALV
ncbi:hypothetical protein [Maritalea mediterranea]|uniref:Uncharacterized protein n=1 Tax=Maritalea mediterranea TaxID=2909667 RepID=A0ABS9E4X1_9HYPH|nr:hypothetical protein [Maritalea mediterranea]MCF4097917.1 hypothetical protein [Maritalea mediterranea]